VTAEALIENSSSHRSSLVQMIFDAASDIANPMFME
jgi:hypothetical protein